jgi:hypothetical protein
VSYVYHGEAVNQSSFQLPSCFGVPVLIVATVSCIVYVYATCSLSLHYDILGPCIVHAVGQPRVFYSGLLHVEQKIASNIFRVFKVSYVYHGEAVNQSSFQLPSCFGVPVLIVATVSCIVYVYATCSLSPLCYI